MAEPVDPRASTVLGDSSSPEKGVRRADGAADPLIGAAVIGQYTIQKKLGAGGMGAVYVADQTTVKRPAVIKVLHPGRLRDAGLRARFEVEAQAASQLNHPHIVTIYNYGAMEDGTLFLAMEYIDGESLEERLKKGPLPVPRATAVADSIADALGEAHRRGVIHRDVKPSNVMLVTRGQGADFVKVLDFGLAHLDGTELTSPGMVFGTPKYMSPEQLRGDKIDGRADLYSLGVVLYELLTGRAPFSAENQMGYLYQHLNARPPRPSEIAPKAKIPPSLDAFVERALAKSPRDRPASAEVFREELRRAMAEPMPSPVSPPAGRRPQTSPVSPPAGRRPQTSPVSPPAGRRPQTSPATPAQDPRPAMPSLAAMLARKQRRPLTRPAVGRVVEQLAGETRALAAKVLPRKKPLVERFLTRLGVKTRRPWYQRPTWIAVGCLALVTLAGLGWLALAESKDETPSEAHERRKATRVDGELQRPIPTR